MKVRILQQRPDSVSWYASKEGQEFYVEKVSDLWYKVTDGFYSDRWIVKDHFSSDIDATPKFSTNPLMNQKIMLKALTDALMALDDLNKAAEALHDQMLDLSKSVNQSAKNEHVMLHKLGAKGSGKKDG